jgi:hypothetical protein
MIVMWRGFLSLDPLAAKFPEWSDYNYVLGNPVMFVDPDGRSPQQWPPAVEQQIDKWNKLNNKEKNVIRWDIQFYKALDIQENSEVAFSMTEDVYGSNGKGDESDAFRHAFFQAINTQDVGGRFTRKFSDAHEYSTPVDEKSDLYMDIHNNDVGIEVGKNNPDATHEELKVIILDKIKNGELLIINGNNKLIKSDGTLIKAKDIRRSEKSKEIFNEIKENPNQKTENYDGDYTG